MQAEPHVVSFLWFISVSRFSLTLKAASLFWQSYCIVVLCTERFGKKEKKRKKEKVKEKKW